MFSDTKLASSEQRISSYFSEDGMRVLSRERACGSRAEVWTLLLFGMLPDNGLAEAFERENRRRNESGMP